MDWVFYLLIYGLSVNSVGYKLMGKSEDLKMCKGWEYLVINDEIFW